MENNNKYFFCYSDNLVKFLRYEKGIRYICTALNRITGNPFFLFERTTALNQGLAEYTKQGIRLKKIK